jgi:hypothetical protein
MDGDNSAPHLVHEFSDCGLPQFPQNEAPAGNVELQFVQIL